MCFIRQAPVQDDQFQVVPRVITLYRFDCKKIMQNLVEISYKIL